MIHDIVAKTSLTVMAANIRVESHLPLKSDKCGVLNSDLRKIIVLQSKAISRWPKTLLLWTGHQERGFTAAWFYKIRLREQFWSKHWLPTSSIVSPLLSRRPSAIHKRTNFFFLKLISAFQSLKEVSMYYRIQVIEQQLNWPFQRLENHMSLRLKKIYI